MVRVDRSEHLTPPHRHHAIEMSLTWEPMALTSATASRRRLEFAQPLQDEFRGRFPISAHRARRRPTIATLRTGAEAQHRCQSITHEQLVRPQACSAPVAVCEGMDSHPLGVRPPGEICHREQAVSIKLCTNWVTLI
jgi:hypothetical protein